MNHTRYTLHLLLVLVFLVAACAKKAVKPDPKLNDPPSESESEAKVPTGPPIVRQSGEAPVTKVGDDEEGGAFVTRAELDKFLDRGPGYVLTVVAVEPVHSGQGFAGYQIAEVTSEARAFITPQMRVGDVVTHVNGVRILRPEHLMEAWRSLDKVSAVRVDFTRKAEPMNAVWVVK